MTLALQAPAIVDSWLGRLDPRWRLAALLLAMAATAALSTVSAALLALAGSLLLACLGRLPPRWCLTRLGLAAPFLLLFVLATPFLVPDPVQSWHVGLFTVSRHGLEVAALLCLKALAIMTFMLVVVASAPLGTSLQAAQSLYVPAIILLVVQLTYRYVFLWSAEVARMRIALRMRGYRSRATVHSYRTIGNVTGILLVRSIERAEQVGQAMRCRGFDRRFRALTDFRTNLADVGFFVVVVGAAAWLLAWEYVWH